MDLGELEAGITAISAPISGSGEHLIGCLILIGFVSEKEVDAYGRMAADSAMKITSAAGGSLRTPES